MNKGLLSISATCSHCSEQHQLSQCLQETLVVPPINWPNNPGSTNIEFTCPDCSEVIYTYKVR